MKKFLSLVALVGIMASCNNSKEEKTETTTGDTATTTNNANTDNTTPTENTTPSGETPKFSDPEVQKFVDDYASFWNDYKTNWNNPEKMQEYSKKMSDWSTKAASVGQKLANNPEDLQKWNAWWTEMGNKMKELVPGSK